jgi:hypothetical protein
MQESHNVVPQSKTDRVDEALDRLRAFVDAHRAAAPAIGDLEEFERGLHAQVLEVEREVLGSELERLDLDVPTVIIEGVEYRRVVRCEQTYTSAAGPVRVERTLYRTRAGEEALCPMELRAGIVEGQWTPLGARQACWVVAHLTPQEGEDLFRELGGMTPSKSSLDRLPKRLSRNWEAERERLETALRRPEKVPAAATTLAVSLDGVMLGMKDGDRDAKRAKTRAEGRRPCGPAGFREVGCGTVSLLDAEGNRLHTIRLGRMPEKNKATLLAELKAEVEALLRRRPDLRIMKLADAAKSNWDFLHKELPPGPELIDFFHAAGHLKAALDLAYGENSAPSKAQFEKLRHVLRHDVQGVAKIIRSLDHLVHRHPRRAKLRTELKFFRRNRRRMAYATMAAQGLPIGSGVVEAACKTLVTARLKRSGMRWRQQGGQAILTFRSLAQSGRWDRGWSLMAAPYVQDVALPDNVIPLRRAP